MEAETAVADNGETYTEEKCIDEDPVVHPEDNNPKILEFQEILERLIAQEMQSKNDVTRGAVLLIWQSGDSSWQDGKPRPHMTENPKEDINKNSAVLFNQTGTALLLRTKLFTRMNSFCRTDICACTAVYTCIGINLVMLCAFGDSFRRALAFACTTAYTFVRNNICHNNNPPFSR